MNPLVLKLLPYAIAAAIGFGGAWWIQGLRLDALHADFDLFKGRVESEGKISEAKAKQQEKDDADRKKRADAAQAAAKVKIDGLYSAYGRLRDSRSGSSFLPQATGTAPSAPNVTFDRSAIDTALSGFDRGITGLLREGDQAIVDLNTARSWAQSR